MNKPIINIDELEFIDWGHGEKFEAKFSLVSQRMGMKGLGFNLTVVPPGKTAFPLHNHRVNDEMFFIVEGSGEVRFGSERFPVREGDILGFPPGGPETAHQIINSSDADLKYLAVSSSLSPEVAEYPDSGKKGVIIVLDGTDDRGIPKMWRLMMRDEDTAVDYWEGED